MSNTDYSVGQIVESLRQSLHQYLEAQYHIWDETLIRERQSLFNNEREAVTHQTPALEATPFYGYGKTFDQLDIPAAAKEFLLKAATFDVGIFRNPYRHQGEALEAFLTGKEDIVVATGTGSGKTESFLMPLLGSLAIEAKSRPTTAKISGVRAMLLYPMNALVNDQLGRLRRLIGDPRVASLLHEGRGRNVTFGMYTSRTLYPGVRNATKDKRNLGKLIEQFFGAEAAKFQSLLEKEGKWPSKDMSIFAQNNFRTHSSDRELFTRHEMQETAPDILVTNYSMLEYMMLRPVERALFNQTEEWLASDKNNQFIIVLDEAHMYRGAAGAEVAFLLRRLQSRLRIDRDRVRYILTSASLGNSPEAEQKVSEFAAALTGLSDAGKKFHLIKGKPDIISGGNPASQVDGDALKNFPFAVLHKAETDLPNAVTAFNRLRVNVGKIDKLESISTVELKNQVYEFLEGFPPAVALANLITGTPKTFAEILSSIFPQIQNGKEALESLLALASFAQRKADGRVFLPVRLHTFYRGVSGLFACVNPQCNHRLDTSSNEHLLGRLFDYPRLQCFCGCRVYEVLTHRDCGAAFIRGFLQSREGDFAWHESGTSHDDGRALLEVHFLVETSRNREPESCSVWLHKATGRIERRQPSKNPEEFIELIQSTGPILTDMRYPAHSFDHICPVCLRDWDDGTNKIMDLATKGEAPFAHLTATQLKIQPSFIKPNDRLPNQGRKNLLFSDGRQKAARLARDIPREIGQDVFRQVLLYAVDCLNKANKEAKLDTIYAAVLYCLETFNLSLFDGSDYQKILDDKIVLRREDFEDISECVSDFRSSAPERFNEQLLRQLGSSFYSVHALALAYTAPTKKAMRRLVNEINWLSEGEIKELAVSWIQNLLRQMAFDSSIYDGTRKRAAGYPKPAWGVTAGFPKKTKFPIVEKLYKQAAEIEKIFKRN